ncbi:MAG: metal ABC transporter substrate-binding protein [Chloroflexota bacterium]|nr:metal ABC transporter substrate-binding protein [Chloroflexota bacterium]
MALPRPKAILSLILVPLIMAALIGCGTSTTGGGSSAGTVNVVATTTVFADMVRNVGGSHVNVTSLVPKNGDVHTFEPRPSDVRAVANAQLLVMNGLGLDDWLERTITNASKEGTPLVKLAVDLPGIGLLPGEEPGTQNPHLFMDPLYAEQYADRIAAGLKQVDPANSAAYDSNATAYKGTLEALDTWVREQVATIPQANRKLVTFHDAFPYYAREYGITIVGVAVDAPGQDPSAGYTAKLVDAIRAAAVKAIFSESQFPAKLVQQLASETGTKVVANLYDDAIGDPPVTSYEEIIRWDTQQLVGALR